jgi:membrane protease YdiL (CAAX protease family)
MNMESVSGRRTERWALLALMCVAYAVVGLIQRTQPYLIDVKRGLHDGGFTYVNARIIAAILYLIAMYSGVSIVLIVGLRLSRLPIRDALALRVPSRRSILVASGLVLVMGVIASGMQSALSTIIPGLEEVHPHTPTAYEDIGYRLIYVVMSSTFTVLVEEFVHRGVLFAIVEEQSSRWTAVLVTSVTFAVLHLAPEHFVFYFLFGVFCGSLRAATGSIWPAVVLHGLHNAMNTAWWLLPELFT